MKASPIELIAVAFIAGALLGFAFALQIASQIGR